MFDFWILDIQKHKFYDELSLKILTDKIKYFTHRISVGGFEEGRMDGSNGWMENDDMVRVTNDYY